MHDPLISFFRDLPMPEPQPGLHYRIMKRILLYRYRHHMRIIILLIIASLGFSFWNMIIALVNRDVHEIIQIAYRDFEMNADYISDFAVIIAQSIPYRAVSLFGVNIVLSLYTFHVFKHWSRVMGRDDPFFPKKGSF